VTILSVAPSCFGQADRYAAWMQDLTALSNSAGSPISQRKAEAGRIRTELAQWIELHPASNSILPAAPPAPWGEKQLRDEIAVLKSVVELLIKRDRSFSLGVTVVNVTAPGAQLSPVTDSIDQTEIRNQDMLTVDHAIEYLPGVSVDHKSPRGQTGISIGGFDIRQVPLYLDGIPAYVPFDGYVDLTRYLTSDVAEVQVARGYSSPLLGPNLLGGVVNVVTKQPQKKFEADAFIGTGAGDLLNSGLHLGSRWQYFFFQGSLDWLQSAFYPISGGFKLNSAQPSDHRVNSYQRDERFRGRVAWSPRGSDLYVLSYSNQKGKEGVPPYSGTAPLCPTGNATVTFACVTPKYWSWPYWNTDNYYFNSNTRIGEMSSVQFRAFYDQYPNSLNIFDNETYTTMKANSSGVLNYNDHTIGASGDFATNLVKHNTLGASFFVKEDTHTEETTTFSTNVASTTPEQTDRDLQSSFGFQDVITISARFRAIVGVSADHLDGLEAQDLNSAKTQAVPFQVQGICTASNLSFNSCTDHVWAYNPVASLSYSFRKSGTLFATFAEKSRFPTLKDRYSYKAGKAVPNPELHPEHSRTFTVGYSRPFGRRTVAQVDLFRSDVRDEIESTFFLSPLCSGGGRGGAGSCMQSVNVGNETHQGFNFTLRSAPLPRLTLEANYSFVNRDISGVSGVFPTGTPKHKTVGTTSLRLPRKATGMVAAQYQSGAVGMSDNGLPLPVGKFATVDMGVTMPIRSGVSLQTGVRNILDRNYYYWEGFPQEGRNWYLTLRYLF